MKDFLSLGSTPPEEECAQLGQPNYHEQAQKECAAFINQLKRNFKLINDMKFGIKRCPHDFGTYLDVVIYFDNDNEEECEIAYNIENNVPFEWDKRAKSELGVKPKLNLLGEDGNTFAILGRAQRTLRRAGYPKKKVDEFMKEATSGDYNHVLSTVMKWFDTSIDDCDE